MDLNNLSQNTPANSSRIRNMMALTLIIVIGALAIAAVIQNRGFNIEAQPDRIGVTLQPAEYPTPPIATYSDASPIVTAPGAQVEVHVTGPTHPTSAQASKRDGLSTHGAASPIVTGQGAVVRATVDTRL
ncbi:hypothetical protein [Pseudomonas aeruginosa]|uniref:hypothetical protein n=1 Tax=Pseudomonas aeruginosa TaxID=287 RepID=UPI000F521C3D|nr:hypothetical protein [Pseudomonas aeruginosa]